MIARIGFEFNRIFSRKNLVILSVILICTLILIGFGVLEYKNRLVANENFRITEEKKIKNFNSYEQYASHGFRVCFKPSPLSVFFRKFDFVRNLEALIDSSEDLNIYNKREGSQSFFRDDIFGSLGHIIYLFCTLFFIYTGTITCRYKQDILIPDNKSFIKTIISRILLLNITFIFFLLISYLFAVIMGITFSAQDTLVFVCFGLLSILFLDFFFMVGLFIAALFKFKKKALLYFPAVWFFLFFLIPGVTKIIVSNDASLLPYSDDLDLKKHVTLFKADKKIIEYIKKILNTNKNTEQAELKKILRQLGADFLKNGYQENKRLESEFLAKVRELIDGIERRSYLIPVDFFRFSSSEISGSGYREYLNFILYVLDLEQEFLEFYFEKRDDTIKGGIESFIKNDENIYKAQSRLPGSFWKGTGIILLYTIFLFLVFLRLRRKKEEKIEKLGVKEMPDSKKFLFLLTVKGKKEELLKALSQGDDAAILENPAEEAFNEDVSIRTFLNYVCLEHKIDKEKLIAYLKHMGIMEEDFKKILSRLSFETTKKIACAIALARNKKTLVINDFVKNESEKFEKKFLELINYYLTEGNKVVYVSEKIFLPAASSKIFAVDEKGYKPYIVSPKKVTLR